MLRSLVHSKAVLASCVTPSRVVAKRSCHLVTMQEDSVLDKYTVATVSLNRPPVNGFSMALAEQFNTAFRSIEESDQLDAVIIKSSVPNIFSSGLDLSELYQTSEMRLESFWKEVRDMWFNIYSSKLPVVAAVNGHCLAGGTMMAAACDYRVAVKGDYRMGVTAAKVGMIAPLFLFKVLAHLIGQRRTELAIQQGQVFTPDEAKAIGLVDEVCDTNELQLRSVKALHPFLNVSQVARSTMKMSLRTEILTMFLDSEEEEIETFVSFVMQESVQEQLGKYIKKLKRKN